MFFISMAIMVFLQNQFSDLRYLIGQEPPAQNVILTNKNPEKRDKT
jgi:hypothetical protein